MVSVRTALRLMSGLFQAIAGVIIVLMMLHVTIDVLMKYFFDQPIQGTLEIVSTYYMVGVVFLPIGMIQYRRSHIAVDLFVQHMRPRRFAGLNSGVAVFSFLYLAALFWTTLQNAIQKTAVGEAVFVVAADMIVWPSRWFAPMGCLAMMLVLVLQAVEDAIYAESGRRVAGDDEGPEPVTYE